MKRDGKKRLNVDIPEKVYELMRKRAHENYCTLTGFVMKMLKKELELD